MAITIVQNPLQGLDQGSPTNVNTSLASPATVGNLIVVAAFLRDADVNTPVFSISDNQGNDYNQIFSRTIRTDTGTTRLRLEMGYFEVTYSSGTYTVNADVGEAMTGMAVKIWEVSGYRVGNIIAGNSNAGYNSTFADTGSVTLTVNGLVFAAVVAQGSVTFAYPGITEDSTSESGDLRNSVGSLAVGPGTYSSTWEIDPSVNHIEGIIAINEAPISSSSSQSSSSSSKSSSSSETISSSSSSKSSSSSSKSSSSSSSSASSSSSSRSSSSSSSSKSSSSSSRSSSSSSSSKSSSSSSSSKSSSSSSRSSSSGDGAANLYPLKIFVRLDGSGTRVELTNWTIVSPTVYTYTSASVGQLQLTVIQDYEATRYTLSRISSGTSTVDYMYAVMSYSQIDPHAVRYPHLMGLEWSPSEIPYDPSYLPYDEYGFDMSHPGYCFTPFMAATNPTRCLALACLDQGLKTYLKFNVSGLELEWRTPFSLSSSFYFAIYDTTGVDSEDAMCEALDLFADDANIDRVGEKSAWMQAIDGLFDVQLQNHIDPESHVEDTLLYPWGYLFPGMLFWGQMEDYLGGCCIPEISWNYRNNWIATRLNDWTAEGRRFGVYVRPDGLTYPEDLLEWIAYNEAQGAQLQYLDHIIGWIEDNNLSGLPTRSADHIMEWPHGTYAGPTLISGTVKQKPNEPTQCPWFGRYLFNQWIMFLGAENWDYAGCGPSANFETPRNAFLFGAKHTVREMLWSGTPDASVIESIDEWDLSSFWSRDPAYLHKQGLSGVPSDIRVRRFRGSSNEIILVCDQWETTASARTILVDGNEVDIPAKRLSITVLSESSSSSSRSSSSSNSSSSSSKSSSSSNSSSSSSRSSSSSKKASSSSSSKSSSSYSSSSSRSSSSRRHLTVEAAEFDRIAPENVVFVYNSYQPGSLEVAEYYRDARGLPSSNIINISIAPPTVSSDGLTCENAITENEYTTLIENPIILALESLGQDFSSYGPKPIKVIILGYGIPLAYNDGTQDIAIASRLHRLGHAVENKRLNHTFNRSVFQFFSEDDSTELFITAVLDGPSVAAVKKLIDRSLDVDNQSFITGSIYVDPYGNKASSEDLQYQNDILNFIDSDVPNLRLNSVITVDVDDPYKEPTVSSFSNDVFYWGWFNPSYSKQLFLNQNNRRVFLYNADDRSACNIHFLSGSSPFDENGSDHWCNIAINMEPGYASCAGSIDDPGSDAFLRPSPFFRALHQGATLGEAYLFASKYVSWKTILIGDPLMVVNFRSELPSDQDVTFTLLPNHEVIRLTKKYIELGLAWGSRQSRLLDDVIENIVSSGTFSEALNLLQPVNNWKQLKQESAQTNLFFYLSQGWARYIRRTFNMSVSDWLTDQNETITSRLNNVLVQTGISEITDELISTSGSWQFEFRFEIENNLTFQNVHFELEVARNLSFDSASIVLDLSTLNSVTGWKYEGQPYVFLTMDSTGVTSNFSGRRIMFTSEPVHYLRTTEVYYVRWTAVDDDGLPIGPTGTERIIVAA